ncbi:MAG: hypothetical protein WC838_07180 [Candidatus Margulisiibacteriota bacterium]|jgi:hypothetical protein
MRKKVIDYQEQNTERMAVLWTEAFSNLFHYNLPLSGPLIKDVANSVLEQIKQLAASPARRLDLADAFRQKLIFLSKTIYGTEENDPCQDTPTILELVNKFSGSRAGRGQLDKKMVEKEALEEAYFDVILNEVVLLAVKNLITSKQRAPFRGETLNGQLPNNDDKQQMITRFERTAEEFRRKDPRHRELCQTIMSIRNGDAEESNEHANRMEKLMTMLLKEPAVHDTKALAELLRMALAQALVDHAEILIASDPTEADYLHAEEINTVLAKEMPGRPN